MVGRDLLPARCPAATRGCGVCPCNGGASRWLAGTPSGDVGRSHHGRCALGPWVRRSKDGTDAPRGGDIQGPPPSAPTVLEASLTSGEVSTKVDT